MLKDRFLRSDGANLADGELIFLVWECLGLFVHSYFFLICTCPLFYALTFEVLKVLFFRVYFSPLFLVVSA